MRDDRVFAARRRAPAFQNPPRAALPLPPGDEPRPRRRGAVRRQARVRARRAVRADRRTSGRPTSPASPGTQPRRVGLQVAAVGARAGRGERRRPAGPVAAPARRPPRGRARRGRVRGRARARERRATCASRSTAAAAPSSRRTPATGSSCTRRATGSTSCSTTPSEPAARRAAPASDDPRAKADALAEVLDLPADGSEVEVGETLVRFAPGGPQGRPELDGELFD